MEKKAANGTPLDKLRGITEQFYNHCNISDDKGAVAEDKLKLTAGVYHEVELFSNTLAQSMADYLSGDASAVDTFKQALKLRSSLLTDPSVNDDTKSFLKNVVHIAENGKPEESLKLTKDLHANALDPHYKGAPPKAAENESKPSDILGLSL